MVRQAQLVSFSVWLGVAFLFVAASSIGRAASQNDVVPRPLGSVDVQSGPVPCDGHECSEVVVTCPEVAAPARARLKVGTPVAPARGTILFASSGDGTTMYDEQPEPRRIVNDVRAAGFRTVQLQWLDSWFVGSPGAGEGHARLACRPATIARWVYDSLHDPGESTALCATGHSGGAAQVSYMLSHYGLENILSAVVPTGGPPMGRLDLSCMMGLHARTAGVIDGAFGVSPGEDGPCTARDPTASDLLRRASVASGDGDYVYPETMVWFVFEGIDDFYAVAKGMTYHDILMSSGSPLLRKETVPGVTHTGDSGLYNSRAGTNTIRDILLAECRPHP